MQKQFVEYQRGQARLIRGNIKGVRFDRFEVFKILNQSNLTLLISNQSNLTLLIYLEQGDLPQGHIDRSKSTPLNYDLQDWQQAKRQKRDPKEIKQLLQNCWANSEIKEASEKAIEDHSFYLACGQPRRGFVGGDWSGKVRSLSRQTGVKAKDLAVKLGNASDLPNVESVQLSVNEKLITRLKSLTDKLHQNHVARLTPYEQRKKQLAKEHAKALSAAKNQFN